MTSPTDHDVSEMVRVDLPGTIAWPGRPRTRASRNSLLVDPVGSVIRSCVADAFSAKPESPLRRVEVHVLVDQDESQGLSLLGLAKAAIDGVELAGIVGNDRTILRFQVERVPLDTCSMLVRVISTDGELFESAPIVVLGEVVQPASLGMTLVAFSPETAARLHATTGVAAPTSWRRWHDGLSNAMNLHRAAGRVHAERDFRDLACDSVVEVTTGAVDSDVDNIAAMAVDLIEAISPSPHRRIHPRVTQAQNAAEPPEEYGRIDRLVRGIRVVTRSGVDGLHVRVRYVGNTA